MKHRNRVIMSVKTPINLKPLSHRLTSLAILNLRKASESPLLCLWKKAMENRTWLNCRCECDGTVDCWERRLEIASEDWCNAARMKEMHDVTIASALQAAVSPWDSNCSTCRLPSGFCECRDLRTCCWISTAFSARPLWLIRPHWSQFWRLFPEIPSSSI